MEGKLFVQLELGHLAGLRGNSNGCMPHGTGKTCAAHHIPIVLSDEVLD